MKQQLLEIVVTQKWNLESFALVFNHLEPFRFVMLHIRLFFFFFGVCVKKFNSTKWHKFYSMSIHTPDINTWFDCIQLQSQPLLEYVLISFAHLDADII